jgi:hypothetical protein
MRRRLVYGSFIPIDMNLIFFLRTFGYRLEVAAEPWCMHLAGKSPFALRKDPSGGYIRAMCAGADQAFPAADKGKLWRLPAV